MSVSSLQRNDHIIIYRTSDIPGKAHYRSVVTSVCTVEEVRKGTSFASVEEFLSYCQAYSVFSEDELRGWFKKANVFVIKMTYNAAFSRRVNRKALLEEIGLNPDNYWGFMKLTDDEFARILTRGEVNESLIINQAGVR